MPGFKLTNKAVEDLANIWDYTFKAWSEEQADKYYEMLISACQKIADNPHLGKNFGSIIPGLKGLKTNRHIIFYRTLEINYVEITRILHERKDLKVKITE